jgi:hypothetical protein
MLAVSCWKARSADRHPERWSGVLKTVALGAALILVLASSVSGQTDDSMDAKGIIAEHAAFSQFPWEHIDLHNGNALDYLLTNGWGTFTADRVDGSRLQFGDIAAFGPHGNGDHYGNFLFYDSNWQPHILSKPGNGQYSEVAANDPSLSRYGKLDGWFRLHRR